MKMLLVVLASLISVSALASHPHDRVCVGATQLSEGSTLNLILQWESGRSYQTGDPSQDPHEFFLEASSCLGDYLDLPCVKSKSDVATYQVSQMKTVPAKLKDSKGQIFFDGSFTLATETLEGQIRNAQGKLVPAKFKLTCVSQPRLTLDISE